MWKAEFLDEIQTEGWAFSSLLFTVTSTTLPWDICFFKLTQPLAVSRVLLLYNVKEKGGKPDRKPYPLRYDFKKSIQKPQVWELKIMPSNLSKIVRSWIRLLETAYACIKLLILLKKRQGSSPNIYIWYWPSLICSAVIHCKKRLSIFPSPGWMSLTKLSVAGNNLIILGQGVFGKWHPGWGRENR